MLSIFNKTLLYAQTMHSNTPTLIDDRVMKWKLLRSLNTIKDEMAARSKHANQL